MHDAGHGPVERIVAEISGDDVGCFCSEGTFEDAVIVRVCGKRERCDGFDLPDDRLETGDQ